MEADKYPERLEVPFLESTNSETYHLKDCYRRWPFKFGHFKHSQWMVLSSDFVHMLMYDMDARILLAYSQHTEIPDEMFFLTAAASYSKTKFENRRTTFYHFTGFNPHPDYLTLKQLDSVDDDSFFVRKVDFSNRRVVEYLDRVRDDLDFRMFG